ncbi:MAG: D-alanine--D-alanine ligase [Patescibacteria group bacterium]|nr:D-alanine--D-alanine ligase [Patescibacteria group bacterium]
MEQELRKKNIGVFFGSGSPEHDVSIITAQLIISGLKKLNYQVTPIYITKQGRWMLGEELGSLKLFSDPGAKVEQEKRFYEYYLDLEESFGKMVFRRKGLMSRTISVDLAFPAFHGSYGEDGTIQGLFEMFGIPYVGCDVPSSAIAMDKALTKQMYQVHNIPTTKFIYFFKQDWERDRQSIINQIKNDLRWPVFVKPVHLGSSIGIAKVKDQDLKDLEFRLEVALHYDNKVLVEEGVENLMDVTCCIIGNSETGLKASLLQESVFSSDLFDFEEKYLKEGGAQLGKAQNGLVIPARLNDQVTEEIQETAKQVYKILGCSGIARVDFLFDKQAQKFFSNEVNPLPGTLYNHLWKASGVELDQLLQELVKLAEEKYKQKRSVNFTFESNILKQLNSQKLNSKKLQ